MDHDLMSIWAIVYVTILVGLALGAAVGFIQNWLYI